MTVTAKTYCESPLIILCLQQQLPISNSCLLRTANLFTPSQKKNDFRASLCKVQPQQTVLEYKQTSDVTFLD